MAVLRAAPRRQARCRRLAAVGLGVLLSSLLALGGVAARAARLPASEYQVKAVFLFNFASFVDWPPEAFAEETSPIVIGVLGENVFGPFLADTIGAEQIHGRPLTLQTYSRVDEIKSCHVLFISPSEADRLPSILDALKGRSILTVGDSENFASRGGMIRFVLEQNKIRLHINLAAAQDAKLTLSSKLLRLAEIVGPRD